MADNTKDNDKNAPHDEFEEEFDFESGSDIEHEDILAPEEIASTTPAEHAGSSPMSNKSLLPTIIGVVIAGFIGWKVVGHFWHKKPATPSVEKTEMKPMEPSNSVQNELPDNKMTENKVITPPPVATITPAPSAPAPAPVQAAPSNNPNPATADGTPDEGYAKLQKRIDDQAMLYQHQIKILEKDLESAVQSAINASKGIAVLQQEISQLNHTVQTLADELRHVKVEHKAQQVTHQEHKERKARKKERVTKEAYANPDLVVYAIIPGRAWLRTPHGKTITVTEGDQVGEFGKVLKIDANNGVVITSTGVTLR